MSASYPSTVKNFLQLQDGVDKVIAAHPNDRGDEITAIETMIGAIGSTLGYTESINNLLLSYRNGCAVEYKGAADLYVRSGKIAIPDDSGNLRFRRNTSDLTVDWTMIDTGTEATSTVYYVYAVADAGGTTFTVKISTSASAPSGCTFYKLIGTFYNDGSGDIQEVGNLGREARELGYCVAKSDNTPYLAITDGVVEAYVGEGPHDIIGFTDANNPPTTQKQRHKDWGDDASDSIGSISMEVKKGNYWKTTGASTVYWTSKS
jgi:hypothetical protein